MKGRGIIHSLGIRTRVLILAVLPIVTVVLLLGYSLGNSRLKDAQRNVMERGTLLAHNLAMAGEFPLFSQNLPLIQDTLRRTMQQSQVRWAGIWDQRRQLMLTGASAETPSNSDHLIQWAEQARQPPPGFFYAPIRVTGIRLSDFEESPLASPPASEILGYAFIAISGDNDAEHREEIIRNTLLITLGGLLGTVLLALLIGNSITDPLLRLLQAVRSLRSGNLDARVSVRAGGEIRDLQQGINEMARTLQNAQRGLEARVDVAIEALQETVAELEERNRELEQARQAALDAGSERTQFLARMSHEIRTPLNAIVGFAKLLEGEDQAEAREESLGTIRLAADQLLHVINDILQFIRLESGATRLEQLDLDIRDLLEDAVAMLAPMAAERGLDLVLLMHNDLPRRVSGDPTRLSQVIVNLVNNAIKFTEKGQIVVEATRQPAGEYPEGIAIKVKDSGIGIDPAQHATIFTAFNQSDSSINRRFGGTGLGLAIANQLVQLMGGSITVQSAAGEGATFTIHLPCVACPPSPEIPSQNALMGKRVLVYDRNPLMRRSLRNMLTHWGMQVFNSGDWERVLEMIADSQSAPPFDTLVLGLSFQEQEPNIIARYLTAIGERHHGDVVLLTPTELHDSALPMITEGTVLRTTKPVRRRTLERLLSALSGADVQRQTPACRQPPRSKRLQGLRVLVAEDNRLNRELLRHVLSSAGADVDEVVSGREAIQAARAASHDVILMDLHMPEVDGIEATRTIRGALAERTPPIFALTADVFRHNGDDQATFFDDWLLKPIDPQTLVQRLSSLSPNAGQEPSIPPAQANLAEPLPPDLRRHYCEAILDLIQQLKTSPVETQGRDPDQVLHDLKGIAGIYQEAELSRLIEALDPELMHSDPEQWSDLLDQLQTAGKRSCRKSREGD